jgi:hypothetical protein
MLSALAVNLYDQAFETVESQGFSPFGYDNVAPDGTQNDISIEGHFTPSDVILSPSATLRKGFAKDPFD